MNVIYAGSFDPAHLGHYNTFKNAVTLYRQDITVYICINELKESGLLDIESRVRIAEDLFQSDIRVCTNKRDLVAMAEWAQHIVRGFRNESDKAYTYKLLSHYGLENYLSKISFVPIDDFYHDYSSSVIKKLMLENPSKAREFLSPVAYKCLLQKIGG